MIHFRTILAALALLALTAGGASAIECRQNAVYDASTNGATKLVTGTTPTRIFVCGYNIVAGGTASVGFVVGTGTNCGTNQASLTPQYNMIAQTTVADSSPIYRGLLVNPGTDLCIKTSAGVAVQAVIYYVQQ